jgi:hypothetical protein
LDDRNLHNLFNFDYFFPDDFFLDYFLYELRYFNDFFDDSGHNDYLLNYFFDFDHFRNFNHFFDDFVYVDGYNLDSVYDGGDFNNPFFDVLDGLWNIDVDVDKLLYLNDDGLFDDQRLLDDDFLDMY